MYATNLMSLLAEKGIAPANVQQLAALSEEWFVSEPRLCLMKPENRRSLSQADLS